MMALPIDPKQVHRRTIQLKTFEDGLWDILTGLIFLLLGIYPLTREILGPLPQSAFIHRGHAGFRFVGPNRPAALQRPPSGCDQNAPTPSQDIDRGFDRHTGSGHDGIRLTLDPNPRLPAHFFEQPAKFFKAIWR